MKRLLTISALIAAVFLINASLLAQGNQVQNQEQFRAAFERTEQVMEMARERIQNSYTKSGQEILRLAEELQVRAQNNGNLGQYGVGAALTLKARERANQAMAVNKRDEEALNLVQRQLEKTDELISRVQNRLNGNARETAARLFDTARENQKRAWELYHRSQYKASLKLSRKTENMLRNMADRVQSGEGELLRLRNQYQQMEQKLERSEAMNAECNNEEAIRLMEQARQMFTEGQNLTEQSQLKQAEGRLEKARQMVRQANRICENSDNLESEIIRLQNRLQQMKELALQNNNQEALKLMQTAQNQLNKAEKACNRNKTEECAAYMKTAQISMQKANKSMGL
ncbi:MAG: hypothetical protein ABIJ45_14805 [Candidatus Zixiibacteriota bacterium]